MRKDFNKAALREVFCGFQKAFFKDRFLRGKHNKGGNMKKIAHKIHKLGVVIDFKDFKALKKLSKVKKTTLSDGVRKAIADFLKKNRRFLSK